MTDRIKDLEREVEDLRKQVADHRAGLPLQRACWQRDILARFAKDCAVWGAQPCQCTYAADRALAKAEMSDFE